MSKMLKAGVEADTISYSTVIKACAEARDVARAEHWMSTMLNVLTMVSEPSSMVGNGWQLTARSVGK